ncbi:hypothetical protein CGZ69_20280 [Streptomyces peucetius subsp. caesius ATCC 27952]|nr:hypothetical protein CGZ69_20280 [Streptomyces peucetius subsp. caesius ATCC 27952]
MPTALRGQAAAGSEARRPGTVRDGGPRESRPHREYAGDMEVRSIFAPKRHERRDEREAHRSIR